MFFFLLNKLLKFELIRKRKIQLDVPEVNQHCQKRTSIKSTNHYRQYLAWKHC